jgi:membrane fusion protein (multidrug efflux system)
MSMKRWLIMLGSVLVLVVVIGGIWGYNLYNKIQGFKKPLPPTTVTAMKADYQDWRGALSAVGSVKALRGADLSAEVDGVIEAINFESGKDVKAGETLVRLRAQDDVARLNSLQASAEFAKITFDRNRAQFDAQAISQAQLDTDAANLKSANAQVAEQQALVDKKHLRAPFAGRTGIRAVNPGQYVKAGDKIVTLQTLDPIHVDFSQPQQALSQIVVGQTVTVQTDSYPGTKFVGTITAIDPQVDSDTRNVQVQATLNNPQGKLLPGMFANVTIEVGEPQRYLTLPQTAVTFNAYGETVFVVAPANQQQEPGTQQASKDAASQPPVAKQVFITVGPTRGDQVAILTGIEAGDEVVTSGQLKLKNGMPVKIDNTVTPSNDPDPKPTELGVTAP